MQFSLRRLGQCGGLGLLACAVGCASGPLSSKTPESPYKAAAGPGPNPVGATFEGNGLRQPTSTNLAYGKWKESLGQLAEARRAYEIVLTHDPKSADAVLGLARLDQLGGRHEQAEQGFKRALQLKPNDAHALDTLGQFYVSRERWPEAIATLEAAMQNGPNVPSYRFHLGVALAKSGDLDRAFGHFQKTVGDAEAHYNIALILKQKGQRDEAARRIALALSIKPELREAQRLKEELKQGAGGKEVARRDTRLPERPGRAIEGRGRAQASEIQQAGYDGTFETQDAAGGQSAVHADWKPKIQLRETIVRRDGSGKMIEEHNPQTGNGNQSTHVQASRESDASEPVIEDWHARSRDDQ